MKKSRGIPIVLLDAIYSAAEINGLKLSDFPGRAIATDEYEVKLVLPFVEVVRFGGDYAQGSPEAVREIVRRQIDTAADRFKRAVYAKCKSYVERQP